MQAETAVLDHLNRTKTMSIREAMDDYGLSGGHFTKVISNLRKRGHKIERSFRKHPITGRRYARYYLLDDVKQDDVQVAEPVANLMKFKDGDRVYVYQVPALEDKAGIPGYYGKGTVGNISDPYTFDGNTHVSFSVKLDDGHLWAFNTGEYDTPEYLVPLAEHEAKSTAASLVNPMPFQIGETIKVTKKTNAWDLAAKIGATAVVTGYPDHQTSWFWRTKAKEGKFGVMVRWNRDGLDNRQHDGDYYLDYFSKLT